MLHLQHEIIVSISLSLCKVHPYQKSRCQIQMNPGIWILLHHLIRIVGVVCSNCFPLKSRSRSSSQWTETLQSWKCAVAFGWQTQTDILTDRRRDRQVWLPLLSGVVGNVHKCRKLKLNWHFCPLGGRGISHCFVKWVGKKMNIYTQKRRTTMLQTWGCVLRR